MVMKWRCRNWLEEKSTVVALKFLASSVNSEKHLIDQLVPIAVLTLIIVIIVQMLSFLCNYTFIIILFKFEVSLMLVLLQYYYY